MGFKIKKMGKLCTTHLTILRVEDTCAYVFVLQSVQKEDGNGQLYMVVYCKQQCSSLVCYQKWEGKLETVSWSSGDGKPLA